MNDTTTKLQLRINLNPAVNGKDLKLLKDREKELRNIKNNPKRAQTTGAKPRDLSTIEISLMATEKDKVEANGQKPGEKKQAEQAIKKKSRRSKTNPDTKNGEVKTPKTILRNKDTPRSKSRVVIKEDKNQSSETEQAKKRNTPAATIQTPLRGNLDSPLKPYKGPARGSTTKSLMNQILTPATTSFSTRSDERKTIDVEAGKRASKELFNALSVGTRMIEFRDLLKAKVAIGLEGHIQRNTLDDLSSFDKILDELSILWKINRVDLDLLEHLLRSIGMLERFTPDLEKYKQEVKYDDLPAASEREVTTIISSLHNLLQNSDDLTRSYTTICFIHFGSVYSFNRLKLSCLKNELSKLLRIQPTQMTYLSKVAIDSRSYVTVFQMPFSIIRKIVSYVKKNNDTLLSLGIKGVQITGSDGLRYTQSLSYLQEKIPVATQTSFESSDAPPPSTGRGTRTSAPISSLPPLTQHLNARPKVAHDSTRPNTTAQKSNAPQPQLDSGFETYVNISPAPSPQKQDLSLLPQYHPDEEKFERRVNLFKSSLSSLSQPEVDRLVTTLLEQIQGLHRQIAGFKKDLKEKSRKLNASEGFVQKAEKEMKTMEMRVETKAHQISEINQQLVKRIKRVMNENSRLKDMLQHLDAEIDIHRQIEKENRFGNSVRAVRLTKPVPGS